MYSLRHYLLLPLLIELPLHPNFPTLFCLHQPIFLKLSTQLSTLIPQPNPHPIHQIILRPLLLIPLTLAIIIIVIQNLALNHMLYLVHVGKVLVLAGLAGDLSNL